MSASLRVVVVDDEEPARARLASLLAADPEVIVAAVCRGGEEAIAAITGQEPDLVFLDVQMPEIDGFDVIEAVGLDRMPPVIFVTAFEEHAVRAFEVRALDYLLKPFDRARFEAALQRAKAALRAGQGPRAALAELMRQRPGPRDRVLVRDGDRIHVLRAQDIDWIAAAGNYVELHVGKSTHLLRSTLAALEQRLDPDTFLRIHRDTLVHVDRIRSVERFGGQYRVVLEGGAERPIARRYQARLEARLGKL
jgi:two-component system LytT family response regulator